MYIQRIYRLICKKYREKAVPILHRVENVIYNVIVFR